MPNVTENISYVNFLCKFTWSRAAENRLWHRKKVTLPKFRLRNTAPEDDENMESAEEDAFDE
jgi:hypothetical protein